jgi:tetratricopeptide (TPR) repeat protein
LIDAATDHHLWAKSYERDARDVLTLQDDLAGDIVSQVRSRLTTKPLDSRGTALRVDPEAFEAYLKARYYWNKRSSDGFEKAIEYFQESIRKDRQYSIAYAGLADTYILLGEYGLVPVKDAYPKARESATTALALDDRVAEAHNALAMISTDYDWDWRGAEREFQRAIELNPSYATARQWYGELLSVVGRFDEALAEMEQARRLDPLSLIINSMKGYFLVLEGQNDLAIEQLRTTIEMEPSFAHAHWELGIAYVRKRELPEAISEFQAASTLSPDFTQYTAGLGYAYARAGDTAGARKLLDHLRELSKRRYVSRCDLAIIHAGLDEKDQAFAWLQQAVDQHDFTVISAKGHPLFDPLRSDPRFGELLQRIGLAQ